ncbi:MAG: 1-deoxy-D-xylulose-5-phosphate reductoisomerase [Candidatus Borkfalkiaceae bacterium]|nr:1-deoxy-D-xylulose-5-phosphate reductoisomerase [Christensenellaceae bacterium]
MKKIALLGSTGSIGRQVLGVVDRYPEEYSVVALAANSSTKLLGEQIKKYKPLVAGLSDPANAAEITDLPKQTSLYLGENALIHCVIPEADIVFVSVVGFCGLKAVLAALNMKKTVALANKEALVAGGELVMPLVAKNGVDIIPVDSEHSAIWQSLAFDKTRPFKKIILTASGGALRDLPIESLYSVTPEIALRHPNWNMGAKITIDCATMFNKGLEVMEAMWLYNAPLEKIDVLIHPQSIVHSMVEYADNALIAQLAVPSMDIPIQLALSYPDRKASGVSALDLTKEPLTFMQMDHKRYPCFDIAINAAKTGGVYPCAASAANEVAVKLFLSGKIKFGEIADYISYATDNTVQQKVTEESLAFTDYNARMLVEKRFKENN